VDRFGPVPGTIATQVHAYLDHDHAARDMLARGVVNVRQLARWIIKNQGWDVAEHAVASACRRYDNTRPAHAVFSRARLALRQAHINTRAHLASAALQNSPQVQRRLAELFKIVDLSKGEKLRIVSNEQGFKVHLDEANLGKLIALVGKESILATNFSLTEIALVVRPENRDTPGILGVVYTALGAHGINVEEVVEGIAQHMILVRDADSLLAYQSLTALTRGPLEADRSDLDAPAQKGRTSSPQARVRKDPRAP
jgi:hypothetical protein